MSMPDPGFPRATSRTWVVIGGRRLDTVAMAGPGVTVSLSFISSEVADSVCLMSADMVCFSEDSATRHDKLIS